MKFNKLRLKKSKIIELSDDLEILPLKQTRFVAGGAEGDTETETERGPTLRCPSRGCPTTA